MNTPRTVTVTGLLAFASLSLSLRLAAEDIVVFAKGDYRAVGPASQDKPRDPAAAAFLAAAQGDFAGRAPYDAVFALINPPSWGRVVSADTAGSLQIRRSFAHGFAFHLDMEHLLPGHTDVVCINGRPQHPGNELLPEFVPGHEAER